MCRYCTILYKGPEHPQIWISGGWARGREESWNQYLGTERQLSTNNSCYKRFRYSDVNLKAPYFLQHCTVLSAPLLVPSSEIIAVSFLAYICLLLPLKKSNFYISYISCFFHIPLPAYIVNSVLQQGVCDLVPFLFSLGFCVFFGGGATCESTT